MVFSLILGSIGFVLLRKAFFPYRMAEFGDKVLAQVPSGRGDRIQPIEEPDLEAVAEELNVSEEDLLDALGLSSDSREGDERPNLRPLSEVAEELGVEESELVEALGFPPQGRGRPQLAPQNP